MFNFVEDEDDEEVLDLSDLFPDQDSEAEDTNSTGVDEGVGHSRPSEIKIGSASYSFEEDIPQARSITDPEVKSKARSSRKRSPSTRDYFGKREAGWSLYCAHKHHLPNLCERAQDNGEATCSCSCHDKRGYVLSESESVSGSDEQEIIFSFG